MSQRLYVHFITPGVVQIGRQAVIREHVARGGEFERIAGMYVLLSGIAKRLYTRIAALSWDIVLIMTVFHFAVSWGLIARRRSTGARWARHEGGDASIILVTVEVTCSAER